MYAESRLVEIRNHEGVILRGILNNPENDNCILIMAGGFGRCASSERKFKLVADSLPYASLRFDYVGLGISDGEFSKTSISKMASDFLRVCQIFIENGIKVNVLVHSLSAAVFAMAMKLSGVEFYRMKLGKVVLLSPALNQRCLIRYWNLSKNQKNIGVFTTGLDEKQEERFQSIYPANKETNFGNFPVAYFDEAKHSDYSKKFCTWRMDNVLHVHGNKDMTVPLSSLNIEFENKVIVKNGDHDLEKPSMVKQWLPEVINFLS